MPRWRAVQACEDVCEVNKLPLISVVTPTWQRRYSLMINAVASVACQDIGVDHIEHVIVSDGPDPHLATMDWPAHVKYGELPEHVDARWGLNARNHGIELATGKYLAYLDDDNKFKPSHLRLLAALLESGTNIGFAYSLIEWQGDNNTVIGTDPPSHGGIDTSAIMHRRELLEIATWRDVGQDTIDWDLVSRWMTAGIRWKISLVPTLEYRKPGHRAISEKPVQDEDSIDRLGRAIALRAKAESAKRMKAVHEQGYNEP